MHSEMQSERSEMQTEAQPEMQPKMQPEMNFPEVEGASLAGAMPGATTAWPGATDGVISGATFGAEAGGKWRRTYMGRPPHGPPRPVLSAALAGWGLVRPHGSHPDPSSKRLLHAPFDQVAITTRALANQTRALQIKHGRFPIKHGHSPIQHGRFPIQHGHSPIQHLHFPMKHGHFPMKHGRLPIKHGHFPIKHGRVQPGGRRGRQWPETPSWEFLDDHPTPCAYTGRCRHTDTLVHCTIRIDTTILFGVHGRPPDAVHLHRTVRQYYYTSTLLLYYYTTTLLGAPDAVH
jgi:hypothetical protein